MKKLNFLALLMVAWAVCGSPAWANIGMGHHVNIISFQQDDDYHGVVDYPEVLKGKIGDVITALEGKAEPYLMIHSAHIHPKDMVNAQVDSLGQREDGTLEDDGLNCEFAFDKKGDQFTLAGICHVLIAGKKENKEDKFILKPQFVPNDGKHATPTWKRLFSDAESGVAIYANIEPAH